MIPSIDKVKNFLALGDEKKQSSKPKKVNFRCGYSQPERRIMD